MGWEAWTTLGVLGVVLSLLLATRLAADMILLGALTVLLLVGVLTPAQALSGFSNEGMITVAALLVVVAGLQETGAIWLLGAPMLGRPKSMRRAQARMMGPVAAMSAFLNNTAVVAMMLPLVNDWAKKLGISPSKLMMPLSFAAILGGTCTLIGTSTNLVVNGMLIDADIARLGLFSITPVGLALLAVGLAYLLLLAPRLLPDRRPPISNVDDAREYTVELLIAPDSPLIGKTIEEAGLRHLPGMFLVEIDRDDQILPAVAPTERLRASDRLVFVGIIESVVDLLKIRGLTPATGQVFKLDSPRSERAFIEAVVSNTCPLINRTIRESRFRSVYNAAVLAVARNGERLNMKIGDIVLKPGDTLLLEAHPSFVDQQRNSRDFYLVSRVEGAAPPRHDKVWISIGILGALVVGVSVGGVPMLHGAFAAAGLMLLSRCLTATGARRSIDWQLLLVIGAAFGVGRAMEESGAAAAIARQVVAFAGDNPVLLLAAIYGVTMLFTAFMTNIAAAVLVFPIAVATASQVGASPVPFAVALMMAASADFATPIGYQTNLMVYGPGGYHFSDYVRIGLPLNLLMWATTVAIVPLIWPFF